MDPFIEYFLELQFQIGQYKVLDPVKHYNIGIEYVLPSSFEKFKDLNLKNL